MYPPVPQLSATMQDRAERADKSMITDDSRTRRRALIGTSAHPAIDQAAAATYGA
jgi:hypothetical protein